MLYIAWSTPVARASCTPLRLIAYKVPHELHVLLALFPEGSVAAVLEAHPFYARNVLEERLDDKVLGRIVLAIDHQRGNVDLVEAILDRPMA
jgi:hypothetical protein